MDRTRQELTQKLEEQRRTQSEESKQLVGELREKSQAVEATGPAIEGLPDYRTIIRHLQRVRVAESRWSPWKTRQGNRALKEFTELCGRLSISGSAVVRRCLQAYVDRLETADKPTCLPQPPQQQGIRSLGTDCFPACAVPASGAVGIARDTY